MAHNKQFFSVKRPSISTDWSARDATGYDVVVIGSGYGGAVSAARIAAAEYPDGKPSVCVLERGKEWLPGTFPDKVQEAQKELYNSKKNPLGLYRFKADLDLGVFHGSGLGGTSLVNANVAYEPEPEVFDDPHWPQAIRDARDAGELGELFKKVRKTLATAKHPRAGEISKVQALKFGNPGGQKGKWFANQLAVNFKPDGPNKWSVPQRKCLNCGDCITGCNPGAKNTLDTNYLAIAQQQGAHLFPQVTVHYVAPNSDGGYDVHFTRYTEVKGRKRPVGESGVLHAKRAVVVSGGALGSTELILRSRDQGMVFSDQLGERFGGNGDFFGIAYNSDHRTNALGWGAFPLSKKAQRMQGGATPPPQDMLNPGPTIVSTIRYNRSEAFEKRVTVQDTSVPKTYVGLLRTALSSAVELTRIGSDTDAGGDLKELRRRALDFGALGRIDQGALNHSLMYLVMGADSASGRLEMSAHEKPERRKIKIKWRGVGKEEVFKLQNELLKAHATRLGARWIEHPLWDLTPRKTLVTVHPLGGCPMGESASEGVVDERGRVFDGRGGFHGGLYVTDASILPGPVGANPFLTICALSDRVANQVIADLGGTA